MGPHSTQPGRSSLHVAIIMDGNGRWAEARGFPRSEGHRAGVVSVRRIVEAAPGHGIDLLTLYAFSSDNWGRPPEEVANLMGLIEEFLESERASCIEQGVRLRVIGSRARLGEPLRHAIAAAETATHAGRTIELRIALDYSSRDTILAATRRLAQTRGLTRDEFARRLNGEGTARYAHRDVDLLIRTGGEQRLSDFLLWECAYAELYFTPTMWPDFGPGDLAAAMAEYRRRERRFGAVQALPAAVGASTEHWLH